MRTIPDFLRSIRFRFGLRAPRATAEPGRLAFAAIAADGGLLARLPRDQARRLCGQAELFATSLFRNGVHSQTGIASRDAAAQVLRSTRQFAARDDLYGASVDAMLASAHAPGSGGLGGLLDSLRRDARRPGDAATGLAMDAVLALGMVGMMRLGPDDAERLMLAASRHAALCLRGDNAVVPRVPEQEASIDAALRIVETVCERRQTLPLEAPAAQTRRDWADLLVELWRDGATLADRELWRDGATLADRELWREGATLADRTGTQRRRRMWEDARDGHAFGAVWLAPSILSVLTLADAGRMARDARAACVFILGRRTSRPGARAATEAARAVLVACGDGPRHENANLVLLPSRRPEPVLPDPQGAEPLRLSMPPARVSLA